MNACLLPYFCYISEFKTIKGETFKKKNIEASLCHKEFHTLSTSGY